MFISSVRRSKGFNRSLSLSSSGERTVSMSCHPTAMRFIISDGFVWIIVRVVTLH